MDSNERERRRQRRYREAMRNRGISDFPLCNKSFNLSYCGFDL